MQVTRRYLPLAATILILIALPAVSFFALTDNSPSFWSSLVLEIQTIQRDLHRQLAAAMQSVQAEGAAAAWTLIILSFLYGVFHAAGPGHGKVVISTYILTQESQLRRGLLLSGISSLCQGVTAIVAVTATVGLLGLTLRQAKGAATNLETLSYGLVALVGFTLMASRARRLLRRQKLAVPSGQGTPPHQHDDHHHKHDQSCQSCGHTHGPSLSDLDTPVSWRNLVGIIASIGLRPCSGAVLVLLVAYSLDLHWAGVGAVLAMSLGTAITVSLLATLSVYARKGALRLAALIPDRGATRFTVILDLIALFGGLVVLIIGLLLLQAAFTMPVHPLR
ncbi:nickel/cobalt transporter [Sneathiella chinensis]|uniref:Nickel/cobalt efflux system n=1 Tax=Sneathiella chinensis TaxID=349750 RepID=A0ABQ5UA51_9PROT|nr:nickel/cobalt transporter [Sneathiella chinensis]GLQ07421.1 nickel/cobalt efflux system [Sneathiella chinensis]